MSVQNAKRTYAKLFLTQVLRWGLVAQVLVCLSGCHGIEKRILYNPDPFHKSWSQPCDSELAGLTFEDAEFQSADGMKLHGWFLQPQDHSPDKVILFAHGRSGNVSTLKCQLLEFVRRHQVAVLAYDYRGYGKSQGQPSECDLYRDVAAARDWLANRAGIATNDVILMGRSLGSAVVIDLAAKEGARALIVESGFTSVPEVVQHHTHHLFSGRYRKACYESKMKIGRYSGPIFISHGNRDRTIPFSHGVRLAKAATAAQSVQFVETAGGHKSPASEAYKVTLGKFLHSL